MSIYVVSGAAHFVLNYHWWHTRLRRSVCDSSSTWTYSQGAEEDAKKLTCRHVSCCAVVRNI